jgi:hypothetical protein
MASVWPSTSGVRVVRALRLRESIVCIHEEGGAVGLAVLRVGSSDPPRVLAHRIAGVIPAWSPDGAWIAYQTDADVRLIAPDGTRQRVMAPINLRRERNADRSFISALVWSRDSRTIYSMRGTDDRIVRMVAIDAATGAVRVVSTLGAGFSVATPTDPGLRFTMAPNGQSFLATIARTRTDLWILENFAPRGGVLDWFRRRGSR